MISPAPAVTSRDSRARSTLHKAKAVSEPVIFLDVDGVLNHRRVFSAGAGPCVLCPQAIERFRRLVSETGARVVLSSTWRLGNFPNEHVFALRRAGVLERQHRDWRTKDLRGKVSTGGIELPDHKRGNEIAEWLSRHPEVTRYAIVDDDSDMLPDQMPRFVQTTFETGLRNEHCERLAAILTLGPK